VRGGVGRGLGAGWFKRCFNGRYGGGHPGLCAIPAALCGSPKYVALDPQARCQARGSAGDKDVVGPGA